MSADLTEFRASTRTWLAENAPESLRGTSSGVFNGCWGGKKWDFSANPDEKVWLDRMAERGWTAPTWPSEYGGGGLTKAQAAVLKQELRRAQVPAPLVGFGLVMIGPTLLEYGTEAQKLEHIPKIVSGEIRWCQGYSEPGAGSDLASLQTRAVRDGDEFVINGQKVWTSYADKSDWMFCLTRTNTEVKNQAGITFLLFDMNQPGVTTRPIPLISGASPFCETFLENARAKVSNVIFEVDKGWTVAKGLLQHERATIGEYFASSVKGGQEELVALARHYLGPETTGPIADPVIRDAIVQTAMDEACFMLTVKSVGDGLKAGQRPGAASSVLKIYGTELNQRRRSLSCRIAGPQSLGWEGPGFSDDETALNKQWLRSRGNTIEGGTSEVQLNIIAKHVLGLPD